MLKLSNIVLDIAVFCVSSDYVAYQCVVSPVSGCQYPCNLILKVLGARSI